MPIDVQSLACVIGMLLRTKQSQLQIKDLREYLAALLNALCRAGPQSQAYLSILEDHGSRSKGQTIISGPTIILMDPGRRASLWASKSPTFLGRLSR